MEQFASLSSHGENGNLPRQNPSVCLDLDCVDIQTMQSPLSVLLCFCFKVTQSCPNLCNPLNYTVHGILQARIRQWVAFSFSRGSAQPRDQTQVSDVGVRQILYQLSHKGSPRILEWVAYPFSSGSSQLRNQTGVSCISGRFFTN